MRLSPIRLVNMESKNVSSNNVFQIVLTEIISSVENIYLNRKCNFILCYVWKIDRRKMSDATGNWAEITLVTSVHMTLTYFHENVI